METPKLNLFQRLWLEILWGGMRLFAMLPYWFKYYVVENLFFCLLYYVQIGRASCRERVCQYV